MEIVTLQAAPASTESIFDGFVTIPGEAIAVLAGSMVLGALLYIAWRLASNKAEDLADRENRERHGGS